MSILDEINEPRAAMGTVERAAQMTRRQMIQSIGVLEQQLNTVVRAANTQGLANLQAALDVQAPGDGDDLVTKHAALVAAVRAVKPSSTVLDLE